MAIAISIARFPGAVAENLGFVSSFRHSLPATAAAPAPHPGSEPKPCRLFPLLLVSLSSTSSSSSSSSRGVVIEKASSSRQERIQTPSTLSPAQRAVHGKKSSSPSPSSPAPRFSKAARRFYNETFREPQRLSKVLAAAGGMCVYFLQPSYERDYDDIGQHGTKLTSVHSSALVPNHEVSFFDVIVVQVSL